MGGNKYKISNSQNLETLSNPAAPYSSGIYYGKVVSIDDELNEGLIKVNIPTFDRESKVFCKEIRPNTLQTNNVNLKKVQGVVQGVTQGITPIIDGGLSNIGGIPILNQEQVDALTKRKGNTPELTNDQCTEVPWAVPLLPKHLQVMPKVGEMCMVIIFDTKKPQLNRAWIGPLMSDKSKLSYESSDTGGDTLNKNVIPNKNNNTTINRTEDGKDLSKKGDFTGGFPERTDVAIMGRNNADIVLPTERENDG